MLANYAKRTLSFLLAMIMAFSVMPVEAFATEETHDHVHEDEIVAESLAAEVDLDVQPVAETEPVATTAPVVETEAVVATEPAVETEPIIETETAETEPVIVTEPVMETEPTVETEPVIETEPVVTVPEETEVEDAIINDPAQEAASLYEEVLAEAKRILEYYLGSAEMTGEEAAAAAAQFDSGMNMEARYEISLLIEQALTLSLTEREALLKEPVILTLDSFLVTLNAYAESMSMYTVTQEGFPDIAFSADYPTSELIGKEGSSTTAASGKATISFTAASGLTSGQTAVNNITVHNLTSKKLQVSFNYVATNCSATSLGALSGVYTVTLEAGGSDTFTVTAEGGSLLTGNTTATFAMSEISVKEVKSGGKIQMFFDAAKGSVTASGSAVSNEAVIDVAEAGAELRATAASGCEFLGWINEEDNSILSMDNPYTYVPTVDTMKIRAVFANPSSELYFRIGQEYLFGNVNEAITKAKTSVSKTLIPAHNGTLNTSVTIPSGVTLLIPFDNTDTAYTTEPVGVEVGAFTKPQAYRTLTVGAGKTLTIAGDLVVSAKHCAGSGSVTAGTPYLTYGHIAMASDSSIVVNKDGNLYAYGYITGSGTVTAKSGSTVREYFQVEAFRGGSATTSMAEAATVKGVFPLSQYYIQNIEVPLTLHAGAKEYGYTSFFMQGAVFGSPLTFIGNGDGMFNLTSGTVTKDYNGATDRLEFTVNGDYTISSLTISVPLSKDNEVDVNSGEYELPINSNITVNIESGYAYIDQDVALLPGAEIIIGEEAYCEIAENKSIYVYDADNWGGYVGSYNQKMKALTFAPGRTGSRTEASLVDAKILIKGYLDSSQGGLYTTSGGANICGEDGGMINFTAGTEKETYQVTQGGVTGTELTVVSIPVTSAKLKNANGSYFTPGTTEYAYQNGVWGIPCDSHDFSQSVATCMSARTCITCNAEEVDDEGNLIKDPTNHTGNNHKANAVEPTCNKAGKAADTVCECGVTVKFGDTIDATGNHTGGTATCKTLKVCESCGTSYGELDADNHEGDTEIRNAKEATCGEAGYTGDTYCKACGVMTAEGDTIKATGAHTPAAEATCVDFAICKDCGQDYGEKNPNNHTGNQDIVNKTAATCGVAGYTGDIYCADCDKLLEKGAEIPATGDHKGGTATCTEQAVCSTCKQLYGDLAEHDYAETWLSDGTNHWHKCKNCTATTEAEAHSGGEANCRDQAKCEVCGEAYGATNASKHTGTTYVVGAKEANCGEAGHTGVTKCSGCNAELDAGKVIEATGEHKGGTASCTAKAVCETCGQTYGELSDHEYADTWLSDGTNHWHKCKNCDATTDEAGHSGGAANCSTQAKCETCGAAYGNVDKNTHTGKTYVVGAKPGNCGEAGHTGATYCTDCNTELDPGEEIAATGNHTGGTASCTAKAVCETCGQTYGELSDHEYADTWLSDGTNHWHKCKNCDATTDEAGHSGGAANCSTQAKCETCGAAYGNVDKDTHTGKVYVVGAKPSNCGEAGHTGATYCTDCDTELDPGKEIAATGNHTGGTASCTAKAVCETCGQGYGELAQHEYAEDWLSDETGHWHKCKNCTKTTDIEKHAEGPAATEDTAQLCTVCSYVIAPATGHVTHNWGTEWRSDGTNHWHKCKSCDETTDKAAHSGGEANCSTQAKCETCGEFYGNTNASKHTGKTYVVGAKEASCGEAGHTGATYCTDCNTLLDSGKEIAATGMHTGGTASCTVKAVCETCGQGYGELAAHEYAETWLSDANNHWHKCKNCTATTEAEAHSGGAANCSAQAKCESCGAAYGNVDKSKHTGKTYVVGAKEASCGEAGHTGATYCTDCNTLLDSGKEIAATGMHTGGTASCTVKAVCETCGQGYGELAAHEYAETWLSDANNHWHKCKNCTAATEAEAHSGGAANCSTQAKCETCGAAYGNVDKSKHTGKTYVVGAKEASCGEAGHTGATYCTDCNTLLDSGKEIAATGDHIGGIASCTVKAVCETCGQGYGELAEHDYAETWLSDEYNHWSKCKNCTAITDKAVHSGGAANCHAKAVCEACGAAYGSLNANNHDGEQELINVKEATCTAMGYTGDTYCNGCNKIIAYGTKTSMKEHTGGTATCSKLAVCDVCKQGYGSKDLTNHVNTEIRDAKDETCGEAGYTGDTYCTDCSVKTETGEAIEATGKHRGGTATCTELAVCEVCGQEYGSLKAHKGGTATCTAKAECEVCGQEYGELKAHIYSQLWTADATSHWHKCENCDAIDEKLSHTPGEAATCTMEQICTVCEAVLAEKLPHDFETEWTSNQAKHWHKCKNCGQVTEVTDHTLVADDKIDATCLETGKTAGSHCEICGQVVEAQTVIEALGHDIKKVAAKTPTYIAVGWNAYEYCAREGCGYTTYEELPIVEKPVLDTYEEFIENLEVLEQITADYVETYPAKDPLALMIKYIRTGVDRYNSGSWNIMAGYEDADFAEYVQKYEETQNDKAASVDDLIRVTILKDIEYFTLPNGNLVDFGHMFGTMDITYHNKSSVNHADVAGWAGDLVDLLDVSLRHGVNGTTQEDMVAEITANYLFKSFPNESDLFSQKDMYGDMDGFYIMQKLYSQDYTTGLMSSIMRSYFTAGLTDEARADFFLKNRLGGVTSRTSIREAVFNTYTGNSVVYTLEGTREFATPEKLSDVRKAACYAFADYLCKMAGDYTEVTSNNYYTVFDTKSTTLAPGITQEINKATTADNKQIVYYIATADINSEYVDVYVNYHTRDPYDEATGTYDWQMCRVMDQAMNAEALYGDPSSPEYIENFNVIAAVNGAGYNMSTGEPGGLLVMGGVEYQAPNANGFFGILKNGKAVIGTTAEYHAMKDQVAEGLAGFGSTLVHEGKISISATSNYYTSRASRTAVGITRTGKVVFMVLDGRQEPVSCGGSMEEIAQIMLEAGCVEAINLDGGGSTTFVAQQPGDTDVSLVNNPSDGFQRSVSTSLMMVSTAPSSTEFHEAVLNADAEYLTVGASAQITAAGISAMGNSVEIPEGTTWAVSDSQYGTITEDGVFTALKNGVVDVQLKLDGQVVGSKTMRIVVPTRIYFDKEYISVVYGESVKLPIVALYNGKTVNIVANDIEFTPMNAKAGTVSGFNFVAAEDSGLTNVKVQAKLKANTALTASITVNLFDRGEAYFDFDNATGGDRQLAWNREVDNATTEDNHTYTVVDSEQAMTTSYTFAIDMSQIDIPERLADLTYMLPGADVEGASAWTFLCQLAERISPLTEVKPTITFDPNFDVDYSKLKLVNDYFELNGTEFDAATNTLTLTLNWIDQTLAIPVESANPMCILSGIKVTPKANAAWNSKDQLTPVHAGEISYKVYMRTSALYTFSQNPANQEKYGLYDYINPNDDYDRGGYFGEVYKTFSDSYTLINGLNGWVPEGSGYAYYKDGEKLTGIQEVDGFYYDFGTDGICVGQNKFTGLFQIDGKNHYAKNGSLVSGWVTVGEDKYCFDSKGNGYDGKNMIDEVELEFEDGLMIGGYTGFVEKSDGNTYHYVDGTMTFGWYEDTEADAWYHFNVETGVMTTGTHIFPDDEARAKGAYYDFAEDGRALRSYFNGHGYYYWAGLPVLDQWVQTGADPDPNAWYHTNGNGHYVTDPTGQWTKTMEIDGKIYTVVEIMFDGILYTFNNANGKLLRGQFVNENGGWYYYFAGAPVNDGWFKVGEAVYYAYEDGHLATGLVTIDGEQYMFTDQGVLVDDGIKLSAVLSEDGTELSVKLMNTEKAYDVYFEIWPVNSVHLKTVNIATRSVGGLWYVDAPMCVYNRADLFHIAAFAQVDGQLELLIEGDINVRTIADHTYTSAWDDSCNICGKVTRDPSSGSMPMYRLYNPNTGEHHYTGSVEERNMLSAAGWIYEGIAWNAPINGGMPVYRVFAPGSGDHHYTMSLEEKDMLVGIGWLYEGIGWNSAADTEIPQYRLFNPNATVGSHHYTSSIEEREMLVSVGWIFEGMGWFGLAK